MSTENQDNKVKDTLGGATKADIQKIVGVGFLGIFGGLIIYIFTQAGLDIKITGELDVNVFMGPFIGIIIGIFGWLGYKQGQKNNS